jgi:hypothetical protein
MWERGYLELFKEAIAYPIEQLSRTNRIVLKTAVNVVGSGCPCGREVTWS